VIAVIRAGITSGSLSGLGFTRPAARRRPGGGRRARERRRDHRACLGRVQDRRAVSRRPLAGPGREALPTAL